MSNIEVNIKYFAFLHCCNLTFSQIEIIIKFLKHFVEEGQVRRFYVKDFLTINVKYCGFFLS